MTLVTEGALTFSFPDRCEVSKYDRWSFYRNQFHSVAGGSKAVDILCIDDDAAWLIEVTDYRQWQQTEPKPNLIDLGDEVASKVRDTLAGLAAANATANDECERKIARRALARRRWRVALHLEQPKLPSRLWPQPFNPADVTSKLRSKSSLKSIDAHPVVLDLHTPWLGVPWTVHRKRAT